ncbi:hypothetical protein VE03_03861 [Pseudogymnoascus sp. 23342-1-I1]|nr:hypothetical protein VE03_03861 [Pseudogymnoascus sp. 23342-1-I1]
MKKRSPESDVRAMAAGLTQRQTKDSGDDVTLSILGIDHRTLFKGSLDDASGISATIKVTRALVGPLYVGAIELVDLTNGTNEAQQLYSQTAQCIVDVMATTCNLAAESLQGGTYLALELTPINDSLVLPGHKYNFNLRYSEKDASVPPLELSKVTADNGIGGTFSAEASSSSTATTPAAHPTGSTTPSKVLPTRIGSSTSTPTSTPVSAETNDTSSGSVSGSTGLSTGAKAGIGAGVAVAALLVIALLVAWWVRRSRRASSRNGRGGGIGEKESVLAAAAPGGAGEYRDADEAGNGVVGGSPVTRKPVGVPPATNEAALADAVSPASTTVGVVGAQTRGAGAEGQQSMLNAEERERWEEEERRLDEDIAEAERRRLGA